MTSNDARPSGCTGFTPFEQELVNAMRDFANNTDAPDFAPATIMRGARRRVLSLVTASVAAVIILAGGGTALAVTAHSGPTTPSHSATSHPATGSGPSGRSHSTTGCGPSTSSQPETPSSPSASSQPETPCSPAGSSTPENGLGSSQPETGSSSHSATGSSPSANSQPETPSSPPSN